MPPSRNYEHDSTPPRLRSPSLSDFGDSTGLFDGQSGNSEGFYPTGYKADQAPVPFKLGFETANGTPTAKMVNERSAPRASQDAMPPPTNTNIANASRPIHRAPAPAQRKENNAFEMSPPTLAPQFGRTTMPQSPLSKGNGYLDQSNRAYQQSQNQNQSKYKSDSGMFIPNKPRQPNFGQEGGQAQRQGEQPRHPHIQAAKKFVKSHLPGQSNAASKAVPIGVPIGRPQAPAYTTTKAAPSTSYGSFGNKYENTGSFANGFKPVNKSNNYMPTIQPAGAYKNPIAVDQYQPKIQPVGQYTNPIDLTINQYNYDRGVAVIDQGAFVDPKKATEDLKALLEGAIEDEDDVPRTRSRRKKKKESGLSTMFKSLQVAADESELEEEQEEDEDDGTVEGIKVKLLPHQVEGLGWMRDRELGTSRKKGVVPKGGILADDMGLGKTLQSVSLIITNPRPPGSDLVDGKRKFPAEMGKGTLVVAPLALIRQWEAEIKDKVADSHALRVIVHHGPSRTKNFNDLKKYDVVITTYQILVSEWGNSSQETGGLQVGCFGIHWYRVILDEAHTIKNRNAKATQACYALRSEYRWCLTGTPMQNNLDELQSLIKFLRIKPYDDLKTWKDQIDRPMKNGRGDVAIKRLQHYLKIFMKRRTKEILKKEGALNPGGKALAEGEVSKTGFKVTERRIEKVFAEFSPEERLFYERLEKRTDKSLKNMMDGANVNYASALVLLLRLRQACNHPKLCASSLGKDGEALGAEAATMPSTPMKKAADDVDDLADMFGQVTVGNKKCDICQLPLSKELAKSGALRCEECEADLIMSARKPISKQLASKNRIAALRERHLESPKPKSRTSRTSPQAKQQRKSRNRNVILDSDDEEGSWVVSGDEQGPLTLGKAGGTTDEDAEGTGEDIASEDEDSRDENDGYESAGSFIANTTTDSVRSTCSSQAAKLDFKLKKSKEAITIDSDLDSDSDASDNESVVEIEESDSEDDLPLNPCGVKKSGHKMAEIITSTKITHLLRILNNEADDHKFIVFSQFTSMLDLIEPFLQRDGYRYTRYDGSMRNDLREASLKMLREEKSCRILLCSLKCGSLGLNLTAATRVVILEPFWNPFVEEQAIDRVHRLTQKVDVIVYKITIKDSVEERILELQEKKRELANQAIEGGKKGGVGKLGMQEIMQLFSRKAEMMPPKPGDVTSYTKGDGGEGMLSRASSSAYGSREGSADYEYGRSSRESTGSLQSSREGSAGAAGRRVKKWRSGKVTVEHPVYGRR